MSEAAPTTAIKVHSVGSDITSFDRIRKTYCASYAAKVASTTTYGLSLLLRYYAA